MTAKSLSALTLALILAGVGAAQTSPALSTQTQPATPRQQVWLKASLEERNLLAERLGEEGAEAFAAKAGYKPLLTKADKSVRQGFDQVYRAPDGGIVVVEAKGGTSALGRGYGFEQATPEWAIEVSRRMVANGEMTAGERNVGKLVLEGARDSKLTVQVVRTPHVLGEPAVPVLERSLACGAADARTAARVLDEATVGAAKAASSAVMASEAASHAGGALRTAGKVVGAAGVVLDGGVRIYEASQTEEKYRNGQLTDQERVTAHAKNAAGFGGGLGGAWAGAEAGAFAGGGIGAWFGGIGDPVGVFIGGAVGGVVGYFGGEYFAETAVEAVVSRVWK
jgi:hypothetical protein